MWKFLNICPDVKLPYQQPITAVQTPRHTLLTPTFARMFASKMVDNTVHISDGTTGGMSSAKSNKNHLFGHAIAETRPPIPVKPRLIQGGCTLFSKIRSIFVFSGVPRFVRQHFTVHWNASRTRSPHRPFVGQSNTFQHGGSLYWSCNGRTDRELREAFPWISRLDATRSIHQILFSHFYHFCRYRKF